MYLYLEPSRCTALSIPSWAPPPKVGTKSSSFGPTPIFTTTQSHHVSKASHEGILLDLYNLMYAIGPEMIFTPPWHCLQTTCHYKIKFQLDVRVTSAACGIPFGMPTYAKFLWDLAYGFVSIWHATFYLPQGKCPTAVGRFELPSGLAHPIAHLQHSSLKGKNFQSKLH